MSKFLRGKDYPEMCSECRARIDMFAIGLDIASADEEPDKPVMLAASQGLLCGGGKCVYELVPTGYCTISFVEYDERIVPCREYSLPTALEAEKAISQAEARALAFKAELGEGASIFREETRRYWEVLGADGKPRLTIDVTPTDESSTSTRTKGDR